MKLYDALKTKRKIRQGSIGEFIDPPLICGFSIQKVMDDSWEVEPEVYETECFWQKSNGYISPYRSSKNQGENLSFLTNGDLQCLVGKRTKLRIEVLD